MKINARGQVLIPKSVRERCGLLPDTEVRVEEREGGVLIFAEESRVARLRRAIHFTQGKLSSQFAHDHWIAHTRQYVPER